VPGTQQSFVVTAQGLLTKPEEFENIIVRTAKLGSAIVRIKDIGRVELDKQDYSIASRMNGKIATTIAIYQQPGANAVATATAVRRRLEELKKQFPSGLDYRIAARHEPLHAQLDREGRLHVLRGGRPRRARRVRVPAVAARDGDPDSRRAGFDHRHVHRYAPARFSINMLTMFGMILAIGLVVDDAIVVVENVEANMAAKGMSALEAREERDDADRRRVDLDRARAGRGVPAVAFLGGRDRQALQAVRDHDLDLDGDLRRDGARRCRRRLRRSSSGASRREEAASSAGSRMRSKRCGEAMSAASRARSSMADIAHRCSRDRCRHRFLFKILPSSFVPDEDQGYFFAVDDRARHASVGRRVDKAHARVQKIAVGGSGRAGRRDVAGYSLLDGQLQNNGPSSFASLKPFDSARTNRCSRSRR
jgi:multidrug efflux pump